MYRLLLLCFLVGLIAAGCTPAKPPAAGEVPPQPEERDANLPPMGEDDAPDPEDIISAVGTVEYIELEGGFYGIVVSDTARYLPMNLDEQYREDGLHVRFRAVLRDDVATIQMWGRSMEILDITSVEEFYDE